jgi:hypothetical protein
MNIQTIPAPDLRNPVVIRKLGIEALTKELGAVGMAYFMRQFETGYGDYTAERDELLKSITSEEIIAEARKIDRQKLSAI